MSDEISTYREFADGFVRLVALGRRARAAAPKSRSIPAVAAGAPTVLLFSPHPDDESINGALPLRLRVDNRMNVVNVAVTLGSRRDRRDERRQEVEKACESLGFGLLVPGGSGLDNVRRQTRSDRPSVWRGAVDVIVEILRAHAPRAVFFSHSRDSNPTHVGTHWLLRDALRLMPERFGCQVVETEYWAPMSRPNLLVESTAEEVAHLVTAVSLHAGEVARNPYHLRLPAWMMDNVRRGAELIGGPGAQAPEFCFATLYRRRHWRRGRLIEPRGGGIFLSSGDDASHLFVDG